MKYLKYFESNIVPKVTEQDCIELFTYYSFSTESDGVRELESLFKRADLTKTWTKDQYGFEVIVGYRTGINQLNVLNNASRLKEHLNKNEEERILVFDWLKKEKHRLKDFPSYLDLEDLYIEILDDYKNIDYNIYFKNEPFMVVEFSGITPSDLESLGQDYFMDLSKKVERIFGNKTELIIDDSIDPHPLIRAEIKIYKK